jgi:hypothetical protein
MHTQGFDATRPGCQTIWKGVASEVLTDLAAEIHSAEKPFGTKPSRN